MQMKPVCCLVLLILWSLLPAQSGRAEEPKPADWSGAGGLSVPTDGDSGPCENTPSYGHGTKTPACTPLVIIGTETPTNDSVYMVEGGIGPFTWSVGEATITASTERAVTISVDGACGSGAITASDSCGSAKQKVRFPTGKWVEQYNSIPAAAGSWHRWFQTIASGDTRTTYMWDQYGAEFSFKAWNTLHHICYTYDRKDTYRPGSIVCSTKDICGYTPSLPHYSSLPGSWKQDYSYLNGACTILSNQGNYYAKTGWYAFYKTPYYKVETWECP